MEIKLLALLVSTIYGGELSVSDMDSLFPKRAPQNGAEENNIVQVIASHFMTDVSQLFILRDIFWWENVK